MALLKALISKRAYSLISIILYNGIGRYWGSAYQFRFQQEVVDIDCQDAVLVSEGWADIIGDDLRERAFIADEVDLYLLSFADDARIIHPDLLVDWVREETKKINSMYFVEE